jgi:hypothetical protein
MADLLDIAPSTAVGVVRIRGERVVVRGLNAPAIASIALRFPDVVRLFSGARDDENTENIARLFLLVGNAIGSIIAAGTGHLADEKREHHASTVLSLEEQLELFTAIIGLTFPNGIAAFFEKFTRLVWGGAKNVKVRLKKSPSPSQPSSDADSRPTMQ